MTSIMDMLAEVPFEETADSPPENNGSQDEKDLPRTDLFDLSNDDDDGMIACSDLSSFYTEPLIIDKSENKKSMVSHPNNEIVCPKSSPKEDKTELQVEEPIKDDVTAIDPSLPEPEEKPFNPDKPDPNGPKYCHCRWGESGVMVECEQCGEWYHDECIGLTEEETYNIETYYCAPCCSDNSDLITKYKEDPVKLRQKIINEVRVEEKLKKPKRKNSNIKPQDRAIQRKSLSKTPTTRAPKPKRLSLNDGRMVKRNKVLNKNRKFSSDYSSSDEESSKVAFVVCEECGDSFPGKKALRRHAKKHEEVTEEKHQCEECGKAFSSLKMLRDHEVVHSGVKPFSCMFCGEAFYLMTQLTSHTNTKHLNVRHQCDSCTRSYSSKPALITHRKKFHGELPDSD